MILLTPSGHTNHARADAGFIDSTTHSGTDGGTFAMSAIAGGFSHAGFGS